MDVECEKVSRFAKEVNSLREVFECSKCTNNGLADRLSTLNVWASLKGFEMCLVFLSTVIRITNCLTLIKLLIFRVSKLINTQIR